MRIRKSLEHRVLPIPFHVLTLWGAWCPNHVHSWHKQVYSIYAYFMIILELLFTVEIFMYCLITILIKKFELDAIFLLTSIINGLYKAVKILLIHERITKLLTLGFEDRWRIPRDKLEEKILLDSVRENWKIHVIYMLACLTSVFIRLIGPMLKPGADFGLPVAAWYPYDVEKPFQFWITYIHQMFMGASIISIHIGADTMLCGLMLQSCVQMKLLNHRLRNFVLLCNYKDGALINYNVERKLIKQYIYDHRFIYRYTTTLNEDFSGWLIGTLLVIVPNICINVYLLSFSEIGLKVDFITAASLFSISLFQMYLPCWYGNEITFHSMKLGTAVYEMDWIDLAPSTRKALLIIMLRATKPIQLTAAYFVPMNINSFLNIMKTSYSVLNILRKSV